MKIGIMKTKIRAALSAFACVIAASLVSTMPARAVVEININKGVVEPLPIAITDFLSADQLGPNITSVIAADLERSGLLRQSTKARSSKRFPIPMHRRVLKTGKLSTRRHW